jgi:hypothetical protein
MFAAAFILPKLDKEKRSLVVEGRTASSENETYKTINKEFDEFVY